MDTDRIKYWLFSDRIPLTKILIVTNVVTYLFTVFARSYGPFGLLVFATRDVALTPWTILTYPIVCGPGGPISLLFACYWLWWAGGTLERSWGTSRFAAYFFETTAITAIAIYVGSMAIGGANVELAGLWLVLAGLTVAFGMVNPESVVLFMFIIPMKLKYLAIISAALAAITYAMMSPLLGIFALAGCAFSYWYVRGARYSGSQAASREPRWREPRGEVVRVHERESLFGKLNPFKQLRRRRSEKRLRKLFEDSGMGEDDR
jgi:membrane associated rhomboid family serine protease